MSKVSVIVITYNGKQHLEKCFESLSRQTYKNFDVYLLDNGSTDGSCEFVKEKFPWVKIIRFNKNYGFAEGYNRAIAMINSEYIALLNDDTYAEPNWLENLVDVIERDESIFAVGSKLVFYDKPYVVQHAGGKITIIGAGVDIGFGEIDSVEYNRPKYVGSVCGGAMLIRRTVFKELEGFDNRYFAYFEDVDLCWRAWLFGYKVMYVPNSVVRHKFGGTWGRRGSPQRTYYSQKNRLANIIKNFEIKNVLKGPLISVPYDFIRILIFLVRKDIKNVIALIKGTRDALLNIDHFIKERIIVQSKRVINDESLKNLGIMLSLRDSVHEYIRLLSVKI